MSTPRHLTPPTDAGPRPRVTRPAHVAPFAAPSSGDAAMNAFDAPPVPASGRLLTEKHAAAYLAVAPDTLRTWRSRRTGPAFVRLGLRVRYRLADLDAWVAEKTASAAA